MSACKDESLLLRHSHVTMDDLESNTFKVHDPCVSWLNGKDLSCSTKHHVLEGQLKINIEEKFWNMPPKQPLLVASQQCKENPTLIFEKIIYSKTLSDT